MSKDEILNKLADEGISVTVINNNEVKRSVRWERNNRGVVEPIFTSTWGDPNATNNAELFKYAIKSFVSMEFQDKS